MAMAMAGSPFYLKMPGVTRIWLEGGLPSYVTAKDIVLEVLRRISVRGGVGYILEYDGPRGRHSFNSRTWHHCQHGS